MVYLQRIPTLKQCLDFLEKQTLSAVADESTSLSLHSRNGGRCLRSSFILITFGGKQE